MSGYAEIRASDENRSQIAAALGEHYAVGRLTLEEFQERLDQISAATTLGELDHLMTDLPRADLSSGAVSPENDDRAAWSGPHDLGDRACCPARPVVRVLIPAAAARPHSAVLLLCGHHYRGVPRRPGRRRRGDHHRPAQRRNQRHRA